MKISKEITIALSTIASLLLLYFGFNFLKGKNVFSSVDTYFVKYDNIDGLAPSNAVLFNGLKVGQVKSIQLNPETYEVIVEFFLNNTDISITKNTIASIGSADLLGTKCLKLQLEKGVLASVGDTLMAAKEASMFDAITPLKNKATSLMSSMDSTIITLNSLMDKETQANLKKTIANIAKTSDEFEGIAKNTNNLMTKANNLLDSEKKKLTSILNNVENITNNFKNNGEKITILLANLDKITDDVVKADVAKTITSATAVLGKFNNIATKIDNGEGTIGKMLKDKELYDNLNTISKDLDALFVDMKARPTRYVHFSVFGKKDKNSKLNIGN